jgi:hypothetical protein
MDDLTMDDCPPNRLAAMVHGRNDPAVHHKRLGMSRRGMVHTSFAQWSRCAGVVAETLDVPGRGERSCCCQERGRQGHPVTPLPRVRASTGTRTVCTCGYRLTVRDQHRRRSWWGRRSRSPDSRCHPYPLVSMNRGFQTFGRVHRVNFPYRVLLHFPQDVF